VFKPTGESVAGKKAVWAMLRGDVEVYNRIRTEGGLEGEDENQFDSRALKLIPLVSYEEDVVKDEEMDTKDADGEGSWKEVLLSQDLFRKVRVENFVKNSTSEECETFLKQFDNVLVIKRVEVNQNGRKQKLFKGAYEVTFKDKESADEFLALQDVKFGDQVLSKALCRTWVQGRVLRRMHHTSFSHNRRMTECVINEREEEKSVFVFGLGLNPDEEIQEYFCGLESEFENVTSAKTVFVHQGQSQKCLGYLLQFEDKESVGNFCSKKDKKFKEKELRCLQGSEMLRRSQQSRTKANFDDVDEFKETSTEKRIILLRLSEMDIAQAEIKIRELFMNVVNVHRSAADQGVVEQLTIVTFASAADAEAALKMPVETDLVRPVNVMGLGEYLEERGIVLEENKDKMEKGDKKYKNIKDNFVKVEGNTIIVTDPSGRPEKKKKVEKIAAEAKAPLKGAKQRASQTEAEKPVHAALARRRNRGAGEWDNYVAVGGFQPKMKDLGKPSDMDICNYFLHNHKDVTDVKFLNWTEVVFVKFQDVSAAERFLSLSYVMFYGSDLTLNDVESFVKKRNPNQKDEVARVLLGKKFSGVSTSAGNKPGGESNIIANGNNTLEVELSMFPSKQADLRNMFITELHLSDGDVGQPSWVKKDKKFTARLPVKLEENAIGYLVRRWNDLQINVGGETVSASAQVGSKGVKREAGQGKHVNGGKGNKKQKFSFYENY